jgi:hypothetical protein
LQDAITTHHSAIRKWIESFDPSIKTQLIGSLQRQTRIRPRSDDLFDIDILVILGTFDRWVPFGGILPGNALSKVEEIVSDNARYEKIGAETDSPAVSIEYADKVKIELVPAYIDNIGQTSAGILTLPKGRGYWIPRNNQWVIADYDYDADYVTALNKKMDGYLIPAIKMLKAMKRKHFSNFKSYYLEILACRIMPKIIAYWKERNYEFYYPQLLWASLFLAKDDLQDRMIIPGSKCLDGYISFEEREFLKSKFNTLSQLAENALSLEDSKAIVVWKEIIDEPFPSEVTLWIQEAMTQTLKS